MTHRKTPRLYVPLDARFFDDDAVIRAGEKAAYLYLNIMCAVKMDDTDGTITLRKISRLHVDNWKPRLDKLIAVGLLMEIDSPENEEVTYLITAWGKWNLTTAERAHRAELGRVAAQKRWKGHTSPNGSRDGLPIGLPMDNPMQRKTSKTSKGMTTLADLVETTLPDLARRALEQE